MQGHASQRHSDVVLLFTGQGAQHAGAGRELYADGLAVADEPFAWELSGNCAYESDFDYSA